MAHPAFDTLAYQIDKFGLKDLELLSTNLYTAQSDLGGYPAGTISIFDEHLILAGSQNGLINDDGAIGFMFWIDYQSMDLDSTIIYDNPDNFYNGVVQIGVHEEQLLVLHSAGDNFTFKLKIYDKEKNLIADNDLQPQLHNSILSYLTNTRDETFFTQEGHLIGTIGIYGFRIYEKTGKVLAEYEYSKDIDAYIGRSKSPWQPMEIADGSILMLGKVQVDLNQQEPVYNGKPFEEDDTIKAAFASKFTFDNKEIVKEWDFSYIDFDIYRNSKITTMSRIHELENGDLFGFGLGNEIKDSLVPFLIHYGQDLVTFKMDKNGCFEQDNCGANNVFYFLNSTLSSSTEIIKDTDNFSVFPQPAHDNLFISSDYIGEVDYKVYNISGALMSSGKPSVNGHIDVSRLSSGLYLLSLSRVGETGFSTVRFVKE